MTNVAFKGILLFALILITLSGNSQNSFPASGSVGIGTTSPSQLLHVSGAETTGNGVNLLIENTATTGQPYAGFVVKVNNVSNGGVFGGAAINAFGIVNGITISPGTDTQDIGFRTGNQVTGGGTGPSMIIKANGNVGIGTSSTGTMKLAVAGNIGARKIIVTQANPFPDYVFKKEYRLRSLNDLENFIQKNSHLPEVPSANEVGKRGLDIGATQSILLKKIEELTLYVIKHDKENKKLKQRVEQLERNKK